MKRRIHRKSRNGCRECKRRHIQCDESKPNCSYCTTVGCGCVYAETQGVSKVSPKGSSGQDTAASRSGVSAAAAIAPPPAPLTPLAQNQTTAPGCSRISRYAQTESHPFQADGDVNLAQMELILHFTLTSALPEVDESLAASVTELISQKCLEEPYLLCQIMAISSRHLAIERPQHYQGYFRQAVQLQSKGIQLFQKSQTSERHGHVAAMLYSSILNRHCLVDALANRGGDFPSFLHRFVQYTRLKKGSRILTAESWRRLRQSELSPLLEWGTLDLDLPTRGHDCDQLRSLISTTSGLTPVARESCRAAMHYIQLGLDQIANATPTRNTYQMAFSWCIFIPDQYCAQLEQLNPAAVAILGWYAILLHHARHLWQIGDSGVFILGAVREYLGAEWAHWLEGPNAAISQQSLSNTSI
ncbi:hypothetical protein MY4824_000660 [Beauveria thailandica]